MHTHTHTHALTRARTPIHESLWQCDGFGLTEDGAGARLTQVEELCKHYTASGVHECNTPVAHGGTVSSMLRRSGRRPRSFERRPGLPQSLGARVFGSQPLPQCQPLNPCLWNHPRMASAQGVIFSRALLEAVPLQAMRECIRANPDLVGSDKLLSVCLWRLGYAFTDPSCWLERGLDSYHVIFVSPGWGRRKGCGK